MPSEKKPKKETVILNESNSELRQDIITKEWILVFTGGKEGLILAQNQSEKDEETEDSSRSCQYCHPDNINEDTLIYKDDSGSWTLRVTPNKNSILSNEINYSEKNVGPYQVSAGKGYHEHIITKSHYEELIDLPNLAIVEIVDCMSDRYINLMNEKDVKYISIVKNYNHQIERITKHPHINIFALPFIPTRIYRELEGVHKYYLEHQRCPYCVSLDFEIEDKKKRIISENKDFIAYCPFTSRSAFEVKIIPKEHSPYFERINNEKKISLGKILHDVLQRLSSTLNKPEYNIYFQTSPCDGQDYNYNHWSIVIIPKTPIIPKFEYGIDLDINIIQPALSAKVLREVL